MVNRTRSKDSQDVGIILQGLNYGTLKDLVKKVDRMNE